MGFGSAKSYQALKYKWDYPLTAGDLYSLDLDKNSEKELYACTYTRYKSYINVFDDNGTIQWTTWVRGKHADSSCISVGENILVTYVDDINSNRDLDMIIGSMVRGGQININTVSYIERATDPVHNTHKHKVMWKYREVTGAITDITSADMNNDKVKEILVASADNNIYVFNIYGSVRNKYDLGCMIYDIFTGDVDNDGRPEIVAGTYEGVYLIDGGVKWHYPTLGKVLRVYAKDVDGDGKTEIIAMDEDSFYVISSEGKGKLKIDVEGIKDVTASDIDNDSSTEILAAVGESIKAFSSSGSLKWEYSLGDRIASLFLLSENKLAVNTWRKIYVLETDNDYRKNQTAYKLYREAQEFYPQECFNVLPLAEDALKIFREINNDNGALNCEAMITICRNVTERIINTQKLADEYYSIAERHLREESHDDATIYAQKAMDLYNEINRGYDVIKCDKLILKIAGIEYNITLEKAKKYYTEAYYFYTTGSYRNSTVYLERAMDMYRELNHSEGITECDVLFKGIERMEREKVADNFYSMAQDSYQFDEYSDALASLEQALEIYEELNLSDKLSMGNSLKNQAENYLKAREYYSLASEYYESGDYVNATYYVNESMRIYLELDDDDEVTTCEILLRDIEAGVKEREMNQLIKTAAYVIAVIVFITVLFFVVKHFRK